MIRSFSEYDYQIYYIVNAFRFLSIAAIRKNCYEKELRAFEAAAEKKKKTLATLGLESKIRKIMMIRF